MLKSQNKKSVDIFILLFTILSILWCYKNWFISPISIGNDLAVTNFEELFSQYKSSPTIWYTHLSNGFGSYALYPLIYYWVFFIQFNLLGWIQNQFILGKIIFLFPILLSGALSAYLFGKTFLKHTLERSVFSLIFFLNPYIMMVASGGQAGVATAYMLTPATIALTYELINRTIYKQYKSVWHKVRAYILYALLLVAVSMYDSRIFYINIACLIILVCGVWLYRKYSYKNIIQLISPILITGLIFLGIHSLWIIPTFLNTGSILPAGYISANTLDFLSFTRLAHSLTLSHSHYPENFFGEIHEVSAIAFIIPLLVFWQLRKKNPRVIYFTLIGLLGVFLSKGTNSPFGEIFSWMYTNIPFMNLFRDATKFYVLIAIGYSFLIALSIQDIATYTQKISSNLKRAVLSAVAICFIVVWWPTFSNQLEGTLKYRQLPQNFQQLNQLLSSDNSFGRVLWIPMKESYGYSSLAHPAVNLLDFIRQPSCFQQFCIESKIWTENYVITQQDRIDEITETIGKFHQASTEQNFKEWGISYVIVSPDYDETLYRHDRRFAPFIRNEYENQLDTIPWLSKVLEQDNLVVYKTNQQTALFSAENTSNQEVQVKSESSHPSEYVITINQPIKTLYFSQKYDPHWSLEKDGEQIKTQDRNHTNIFSKELNPGSHRVFYKSQELLSLGYSISTITILTLVVAFVISEIQIIRAKK